MATDDDEPFSISIAEATAIVLQRARHLVAPGSFKEPAMARYFALHRAVKDLEYAEALESVLDFSSPAVREHVALTNEILADLPFIDKPS